MYTLTAIYIEQVKFTKRFTLIQLYSLLLKLFSYRCTFSKGKNKSIVIKWKLFLKHILAINTILPLGANKLVQIPWGN